MALSKLAANSFDLTDNYALTGTVTGVTSTQKLFLIKNIDASSDSTISFVDGSSSVVLDNTYKTYYFKYINVHPATNEKAFCVNFRDGGSNYDATKTTSWFQASHTEGGSTSLAYDGNRDLAQGTGVQQLSTDIGNGNDESVSGELWLFNPSNTTFVTHFMGTSNGYYAGDATSNAFCAGYCNTTTAIDAVQFSFVSGNIDSGRIALYGIK